jgi:hypothetical protein
VRTHIVHLAVFSLWLALSFSLAADGKPKMTMTILSERTKEFSPGSDCAVSETCSLKKFKLIEMKKALSWSDHLVDQRLTDIRAIYETEKVEDLEKYVIVQFIRGCYYRTFPGDKQPSRVINIRNFFGKKIEYKHSHWQIDSDDTDPVYNSDEEKGRFGFLRWNSNPKSFDANHPNYYFKEKPKHPIVFVADMPGVVGVFYDKEGAPEKAENSSLEFKTCIYHVEDVPTETDPEGLSPDKAIACLSWEHKFAYDFKTNEFVAGGEIAPICLK